MNSETRHRALENQMRVVANTAIEWRIIEDG